MKRLVGGSLMMVMISATGSLGQQLELKQPDPLRGDDATASVPGKEKDPDPLSFPAGIDAESSLGVLLQQGLKLIRAYRFEAAVDSLQRVLAIAPENKTARFALGTCYIKLLDYRKALEILVPLSIDYPHDYNLKNNLAWLFATAKDLKYRDGDKAIQIAQEALILAPRSYHVWSTLSEGYYIRGEFEKAERAATQALNLARIEKASWAQAMTYAGQAEKCRKSASAAALLRE